MKMPNREAAIRSDVKHRQAVKKKWDKHCKYSSDEMEATLSGTELYVDFDVKEQYEAKDGDNYIRLLDEGVVVDGGDWVYAVLEKGVLKRFFDELPKDFSGYIDKDHVPAIYLGKYSKNDLKLVELPNDRYALDVNIKLDKSLFAVQDLLKEGGHNAVSVEMFTKVREYATVSKVTGMSEKEVKEKYGWDYLVPIIEDLAIPGFAICKAPKNANSYKDGLLENASASEGEEMEKDEKKKAEELAAATEAENAAVEKKTENAAEDEDNSGITEEKTGECNDSTENASAAEKADDASEDQFAQVKAAIAELKAQNAEKDAKIAELQAQLDEKKESEKSATMSTSDRIAELLSFATSTEPAAGEGAGTAKTTSKMSEAQKVEEFYREGFAQMNK